MDNEGIAFGDYLNFVGFADTIIVNCPLSIVHSFLKKGCFYGYFDFQCHSCDHE